MKNIEPKLKDALRLVANGVFVVSAEHQGQVRGFTATWVSQVSYEHPLVMVSVSKDHDTYPLITGSRRFVVNILGARQREIATHFGRKKADMSTVDSSYFREEGGRRMPVLRDALAYLICDVVSVLEVEDHTIFVGKAADAAVQPDESPLLYWPRKGYVTAVE
ncbi:MAG: flavin reductase family protein [Chloroflexi bacterium]|nr:flavin reductase family protein [Chloroflexota bacterium]